MNKIIQIAASQLGISEVKGEQDNPAILNYAQETDIKNITHDEIPWCSIFINWCCKKAGLEYSGRANARSWLEAGINTTLPKPGDVVIFWRDSPTSSLGHVAFFLGYSKNFKSVFVLGGNQNNSVSISEYTVDKILGFRKLRKISASLLPAPVLKLNDRGKEVVKLQNILNQLNYNCGNTDGIFGIKTQNALKLFQRDNILTEDGIYGKATMKVMEKQFRLNT